MEAYKDSANVWTIGYGHTKDVTDGMKITQEEAEELFEADIKIYYNCVILNVGSICTNNQVAALTSFTFNLGVANFEKSTLLKVVKKNPSDFKTIRKEFVRWVYAGDKVVNCLKLRRSAEADIYCS